MLRRRTSLKAAVLRAALEDQKLAEPYRKLAQHYGTGLCSGFCSTFLFPRWGRERADAFPA
jgi:hypothetical protein